MDRDLMITKQDLIDWIDRPPSNNDLDLAIFISTRLEKFYDLEQKLQQKENIIKEVKETVKWAYKEDEYQGGIYTIEQILDKEK